MGFEKCKKDSSGYLKIKKKKKKWKSKKEEKEEEEFFFIFPKSKMCV